MHWGWEKSTQPDNRQRSLARRLIDEGASLVVGSHPHVTQGAEIYRGKPIVYSLGNFVFDGFDYENARRGWLLRLEIDRDGVRHWTTLAADIDRAGTPHPVPAWRLLAAAGATRKSANASTHEVVARWRLGARQPLARCSNPLKLPSPMATVTRSTRACVGPRCAQTIRAITAVSSPTSIASTLPFARLRTQPATPSRVACSPIAQR
jgi:hypothetical protein